MSSNPAFDGFLNALARLESPEFLEDLSEQLAHTVEGLLEKSFTSATSPATGKVWEPRKLARGRQQPPHLPLYKSHDMHDSFVVESNAAGVRVTNDVFYAGFQNDGTRDGRLPARGMVPRQGELGTWEEPIDDTAREFLASKLAEIA
jgi:phage gpG-like protein